MSLYERFERGNRAIKHPKTRSHYLRAIHQFSEGLGRPATLDDLTDDKLVQFEKSLEGLAVSTINERLRRLKAVWSWCCKKGLKNVWPTVQAQPEPEPHRRAWSVEEVRRLLAACDAFTMQGPRQEAKATSYDGVPAAKWWRLFHLVAWECGERTAPLLELKWAWLSGTGLDIPAEAERDVARRHTIGSAPPHGRTRAVSRTRTRDDLSLDASQGELLEPLHEAPQARRTAARSQVQAPEASTQPSHMVGHWRQDATQRAKHSDPMTTVRSYLDETLFPQIDPSSVLPSLETRKAGGNNE